MNAHTWPTRPTRPTRLTGLGLIMLLFVPQTARAQPVTFSKDIAPIVFDACASCHRPGGPGPFSLTTYREVRQHATQIARVTQSRFMPPWKVEPGVGHFVGQWVLTADELDLISRWVRDGAPERSEERRVGKECRL